MIRHGEFFLKKLKPFVHPLGIALAKAKQEEGKTVTETAGSKDQTPSTIEKANPAPTRTKDLSPSVIVEDETPKTILRGAESLFASDRYLPPPTHRSSGPGR